MRVLVVTNLYPNPLQPFRAAFNREQFRHLAKRHAVAVIAPVAWTDEVRAWRRAGTRMPRGRRELRDGIVVDHPHYLYPPGVLRGAHGFFYERSIARSFREAQDAFSPHLVFATWAYPDGWAAVRLGHDAGLPVVVKVHGSDVRGIEQYPSRRRRTAEGLCRADAVVAVSKDLSTHVTRLGVPPERVHLVYNGVDTEVFCPGSQAAARAELGLPPGLPIILFVGNLVPVKGPDVLVHACRQLKLSGTRFACYLAGHGELFLPLRRQIAQSGLDDCITLVGPQPHARLPAWYRAADVVALPSHSEGVPNVLLEASACGRPFVASRVGGVPEAARWGESRLVPPGDAGALATALREFLGPRPRPPAQRFARGHADAVADLTAVFEQVLAGTPHRVPLGTGTRTEDRHERPDA